MVMNRLEKILVAGAVAIASSVGAYTLTHSYRPTEARTIDIQAADAGKENAQDQWTAFFNKKGQGMMSAPDMYLAGKTDSRALLISLQEDFKKGIITSTRVVYDADDFDTRFIHNHGSAVSKPTHGSAVVPFQSYVSLSKILETKEGLRYMRALFNTQDSAQDITRALEKLSLRISDKIVVFTPSQSGRKNGNEVAAHFIYDLDTFTIDLLSAQCDYYGKGIAHGVTKK